MPWTVSDVDEHIKGLTPEQKKKWVATANSVLAKCKSEDGKDCDAQAIRVANSQAHNETVQTNEFAMNKIKLKDIETQEVDEGLLIQGIPVFKTGTHKGHAYDEDYIDKKMIGQFSPDDDIPLQADHSDSWNSTLGWVKKIYRKGKMLFADFVLVDDNAVARWKKGLMKKWSVSIHKTSGKLQEISAVAFPYVKEAAVHGDVLEDGMKDYVVEEIQKAPNPPKREVVEIEAHESDAKKEKVNITDDEINSLSSSEDIIQWSDKLSISINSNGSKKGTKLIIDGKTISNPMDVSFSLWGDTVTVRYSIKKTSDNGVTKTETYEYRNPSYYASNNLPDSSFALVKNPIKDKMKDRVLQYKDASGKLDPALLRNAMANIDEVEGFSDESVAQAKELLTKAASKIGEKVEEDKMSDVKKPDVQESVLLKEALEKEIKLAEDIKLKEDKISELEGTLKAKETEIAAFKVDKEIAALKAEGKLVPAQEAETKEFMLSLNDEARAKFIAVLKSSKATVTLGESGAQEQKKDEAGMDFDKMSADEIESEIEKYAKKEGIPVEDARDVLYEKYGSKATE
jgi:archaellum component FlaF (FlaF/FlaG flagellin family)